VELVAVFEGVFEDDSADDGRKAGDQEHDAATIEDGEDLVDDF